jgi:hypothetical protein
MIDVRSALATRAESLTSKNPDLSVQYTIYTDDRSEWGIMHILNEEGKVVGLEFFETEESWRRPGAVRDYNIAADEGYPVAVIVPDSKFMEFRRSVIERGGEGFSTYLYSDFNIQPMIRV